MQLLMLYTLWLSKQLVHRPFPITDLSVRLTPPADNFLKGEGETHEKVNKLYQITFLCVIVHVCALLRGMYKEKEFFLSRPLSRSNEKAKEAASFSRFESL